MVSFSARLSQMLVLLPLLFSLSTAKKHGSTRGVGLKTETPTESPIQIAIEDPATEMPAISTPDETSDVGTITDIAVGDEDLAFLVNLLSLAGVADALAVDGPLTVFAPTNAAFTNLLAGGQDISALGIENIADVLSYHVVAGSYMASDITDGLILPTLQGETIEFGINDGVVTVNGEVISVTDIPASNGFIHKIDGVMFPQTILGDIESPTPDVTMPDDTSDVGTITDIAVGAEDLSILVELLILAGLTDALAGDGPLTVFAPTNAAFTEVLIDTEDFSALDIDEVTKLLTYHVVAGSYMASDITDGLILPTLQGETIEFGINDGVVTVNEEVISVTDIPASNGLIHIIDGVMFPKAILTESDGTAPEETSDVGTITDIAVGAEDLSILVELLILAGLTDALAGDGPLTVFAPTNAAFTEVLIDTEDFSALDIDEVTKLLTYHVVAGSYMASDITDGLILPTLQGETIEFGINDGVVTVNEEVISVTDIPASNGLIHIIDGVMFPKAILTESDGTAPEETSDVGTITDIAVGDEDLAFLVNVLTLAGLTDALAGDGPLTVFAPTNAAFTNLLAGGQDISALGIENIADVLSYHVVAGSYMASDITDGLILPTLQGETIEFGINDGVVTVNGEVISVTDIPASNGLIHKIEGVMFPQSILTSTTPEETASLPGTIVDVASSDPEFGVLVGLLIETDLVDTLSSEGPFTVFAPTDTAFISTLGQEAQDASIVGDSDPNEVADVLAFVSALDEVGVNGTLSSLYDPSLVSQLLTYHVVLGTYMASDITNGLILPTVNGETIAFNVTDDGVTVNGEAVMVADISASNGVIHKIDGVLVPDME